MHTILHQVFKLERKTFKQLLDKVIAFGVKHGGKVTTSFVFKREQWTLEQYQTSRQLATLLLHPNICTMWQHKSEHMQVKQKRNMHLLAQ
jgi:CRISPR/Cas system-associated endonuclease/helicase Cas3